MNFGNQQSLERINTGFSRGVSILSATVGICVLFGWEFKIESVLSIFPGLSTMKFNTAIAFILLGISLWTQTPHGKILPRFFTRRGKPLFRVSDVCAALVAIIGSLTLGEYLFESNLGIDDLFVQDEHIVHNPFPGRMSRISALDFLLLGIAFLIIDVETPTGRRPAQGFAIAVLFSGLVAVLGYAYGVESLYSIGGYASTALHTDCLLVLTSAGFLCLRPGKGLMVLATDTTAGGWIFRNLTPVAFFVVPLLGWLRLEGQRIGLYGFEFGTALLVVSNVVVLSVLIWWAADFLRSEIRDRAETQRRMEMSQERVKEQAAILEQRVRERTAELEETVAELERSTYTISHNLRAPIRTVLAFSDFMRADFTERLGTIGEDYVKRIETSARRMDRLIEGVIAYSRVSRSELRLTPVNLDEFLEGLVPDYAGPADIRISHPLGTVRANEYLLDQAVSNLLENAVKFVPPGKKPQIEVWSELKDGRQRLVIRDHGIGVPAQVGDKIFGSFQRAHEEYPGSGIGLAIVKRAVERMAGEVGFDSKTDEGSSFWVELPKA